MGLMSVKAEPVYGLPNPKPVQPNVPGKSIRVAFSYSGSNAIASSSTSTILPVFNYTESHAIASGSTSTVLPVFNYSFSTSVA